MKEISHEIFKLGKGVLSWNFIAFIGILFLHFGPSLKYKHVCVNISCGVVSINLDTNLYITLYDSKSYATNVHVIVDIFFNLQITFIALLIFILCLLKYNKVAKTREETTEIVCIKFYILNYWNQIPVMCKNIGLHQTVLLIVELFSNWISNVDGTWKILYIGWYEQFRLQVIKLEYVLYSGKTNIRKLKQSKYK